MPRSRAARVSDLGRAEPPTTIFRLERSTSGTARCGKQHLKYRGHAVREGHAFVLYQLQQDFRRIAAGVDLLHARRSHRKRTAPTVDVKQRCHRHVHIVPMKPPLHMGLTILDLRRHHMQQDLTMAEIHALGPACRAGRVERRRPCVLVEIGKLEERRACTQQLFVFTLGRQVRDRPLGAIVQQDVPSNRRQLVAKLLEKRQEIRIDQYGLGARVIQGMNKLFRREARIQGLQHGAHHRNGEVAFMVAMGIPVQDRNNIAWLDAKLCQSRSQLPKALAKLPVSLAFDVAIDDLLLRHAKHGHMKQMLDQQRVPIGGWRDVNQIARHDLPPDA